MTTTIVNWRISDPSDPDPDAYLATYTTEARAREAHAPEDHDRHLRKRDPVMTPTTSQWSAYQAAFDHFNRVLFGGCLDHVILNFSRMAKSYGFCAPDRWAGDGETVTEISLNPTHLAERPLMESMSTLVHEMVHAWQFQSGTPSRRGYHNREWAAKMKECGLYPSSTGAEGGAETGQRMTHYIIPGGVFVRAFESLPEAARLPFVCHDTEEAKKKARNKVKYTCEGCGCNVWGKPGISVTCSDCELPFSSEDGDEEEV